MRVDLWSDIACPWCWLGKHHLEEAIRRAGMDAEVEVRHRAYELRPHQGPSEPARPFLERKFGSPQLLAAAHDRLRAMGRAVGIAYDFEHARLANTFDAHRLVKLAAHHGREASMVERLMQAYHGEGADIAAHGDLRRLAADVGVPAADVDALLSSDTYAGQVRADEAAANDLGITGVPFFVFDGRYGVSGAQPAEVFVQVLARVQALAGTVPQG